MSEKVRIHWRQVLVALFLGTVVSHVVGTIRDRYREFERKKAAAWQVVNAWDEEVRVNAIALRIKTEVASKLETETPEDVTERSLLLAQMRSTKLSSFALQTMAIHFVSLEALGQDGSSVSKAMGEFYRSLERVEKEEA